MITLIPAFRPDPQLPRLVREIKRLAQDSSHTMRVVVINDGSGAEFTAVFSACATAGAHVITHQENLGKGAALRTGLMFCERHFPGETVVTADADGQHLPADILRVALAADTSNTFTLGVRDFTSATLQTGVPSTVPLRSRLGNTVTSALFRAATGWRLEDTQTGLRGIPGWLVGQIAKVPGNRYEYELRMLFTVTQSDLPRQCVKITTVYSPGNSSSHFRPLADSARIYLPLMRALARRLRCNTTRSFMLFAASSLFCTLIDYALALTLATLTSLVFLPLAIARMVSSGTNFILNRQIFTQRPTAGGAKRSLWQALWRYLFLAGVVLAGAYLLVRVGLYLGLSLWAAKLCADTVMFVLSFVAQRSFVFCRRATVAKAKSSKQDMCAAPDVMAQPLKTLDRVDNVH